MLQRKLYMWQVQKMPNPSFLFMFGVLLMWPLPKSRILKLPARDGAKSKPDRAIHIQHQGDSLTVDKSIADNFSRTCMAVHGQGPCKRAESTRKPRDTISWAWNFWDWPFEAHEAHACSWGSHLHLACVLTAVAACSSCVTRHHPLPLGQNAPRLTKWLHLLLCPQNAFASC